MWPESNICGEGRDLDTLPHYSLVPASNLYSRKVGRNKQFNTLFPTRSHHSSPFIGGAQGKGPTEGQPEAVQRGGQHPGMHRALERILGRTKPQADKAPFLSNCPAFPDSDPSLFFNQEIPGKVAISRVILGPAREISPACPMCSLVLGLPGRQPVLRGGATASFLHN